MKLIFQDSISGLFAAVVFAFFSIGCLAFAGESQQKMIEEIMATKASTADEGVVRVTWPRKDVVLAVDKMRLNPPAGLTSWAAFKPLSAEEDWMMLMGDTVVFEDEITPAMDAAFVHGLEVTALHNHFIFDRPPVYFMHIGGMGKTAELAKGVDAIWDAIRDVREVHPQPRESFSGPAPIVPGKINATELEKVFGARASIKDGVVKFSFGRSGKMRGFDVGGASMGLSTWAAFSGGDELAAVGGDFMMTAEEVQPVMHALREKDIHIVALHNHMIGEDPPLFFLHFWGKGPAADLAHGVKAAMEAQSGTQQRNADARRKKPFNEKSP